MARKGIAGLSRPQLEERYRLLAGRRLMDGWFNLGYAAIKFGCIAFCAYQGWKAIDALAGQETLAQIGLRMDVTISYAVAVSGAAYGLWQRKLRRDTVEELQRRNTFLERLIDPKRTTSGLSPRGETRKGDA